jgi:hypothetical protein
MVLNVYTLYIHYLSFVYTMYIQKECIKIVVRDGRSGGNFFLHYFFSYASADLVVVQPDIVVEAFLELDHIHYFRYQILRS